MYTITETQPAGYLNGRTTVGVQGGTAGTDVISAIVLPSFVNGYNNNFGELKPVVKAEHTPDFPTTLVSPPSFVVPTNIPIISKSQLLTGDGHGVSDPMLLSDAKFVNTIYTAILGRGAEAGGLRSWMLYLRSGGTRSQLVDLIWNSDEHRARQVDAMTREILNQPAGPEVIAYYQNLFRSGWTELQVAADIFRYDASLEGGLQPYLDKLYDRVLGTSPTQEDVDYYSSLNLSPFDIAQSVLGRPDAQRAVVQQIYGQLLARGPSQAEIQGWLGQFQSGMSFGGFVTAVLKSNEFAARVAA